MAVQAEEQESNGPTVLVGRPKGRLLVAERHDLATDVIGLSLVDPDGAALPEWEPGAHVDLVLPSGLLRSYSICSDPADRSSYAVAVLREEQSTGGSRELHDEVTVGTELGYLGPRNHFELVDAASYLFLAGGIGITPLVAMMRAVANSGRPFRLVYGGRRRDKMAFADELVASYPGRVELVVEEEVGSPEINELFNALEKGTAVYCCGPSPMITAAERASWRIGTQSLHIERFKPLPIPVFDRGKGEISFEIELARSGVVLQVPRDRSVLSVLREAVPDAPSSCGSGSCGVCETRVLSGEIDHRDRVLSKAEADRGDTMMVCVSRSKGGRLVLDV